MKNSIKLLSLLLAISMCLCLVACGGSSSDAASGSDISADDDQTTAAATDTDLTPADDTAADEEADVSSDLAYVQGNGKMIIGYTVYEPMNYTDEDGNFTGFDTELAQAVCEKLGIDAEFVIINWDTKEVALEAGDIDCIWNGLTLTPDREENMACTDPYVMNAQVVVMKSGSDYTDTSSLAGLTVCAEIGSAGEQVIKGGEDYDADEGLSQADYVGKSVQTDCLMEVKAGTADAAVLDLTLARSMTGEGTNYEDLEIVDYLEEETYGVAFRKGSDIRDEVNRIFEELRADGTMQALAEKYGLTLAE
jgi:polar amino acid transport system substrate-binding protein